MIISIDNFKSIAKLDGYELKPLTLLAGVNSSGKSSLIQSLLLLKQSEESGTKSILKLDGPYLYANSLLDLIYMKRKSNNLRIGLSFNCDDFDVDKAFSFFDNKNGGDRLQRCGVSFSFIANSSIHLKELACSWSSEKGKDFSFSVRLKSSASDIYDISFSDPNMVSGLPETSNVRKIAKCKLEFRGFTPVFATSSLNGDTIVLMLTAMKEFHDVLASVFSGFNYVGPLRVKPVLAKSYNTTNFSSVGIDGDNTRFILNQKKNDIVDGYGDTLFNLCKLWVCDKMKLADDMDVVRDSDKLYRMYITNHEGIKVDLMHMGFGLSQVLPVIVQGLLTPVGGTLIVEDPDVHLHPKVQADIMDFLLDLSSHNRRVIAETHSDHMVTRLRRRISESSDGEIRDKVNLTFVEENGHGSLYNRIDVTETGAFTHSLPPGFLDSQDADYRAILVARANKEKSHG